MQPGSLMRSAFSGGSLLHGLARNWWLILARGLSAIGFGALAFIWPGPTLLAFVLVFAAFALIDGLLSLIAAISGEAPESRWWLALCGIVGVVAGALTFVWPAMTALTLLVFIGCWSVARGALEILGAIRLRKLIDREWWLIAAGVLSIVFGVALLVQPAAGAIALIYVIGAYAILYGILLAMLSLRLRAYSRTSGN
jgi:uncharacterized membrane protein HdeD (DUF308 family)